MQVLDYLSVSAVHKVVALPQGRESSKQWALNAVATEDELKNRRLGDELSADLRHKVDDDGFDGGFLASLR